MQKLLRIGTRESQLAVWQATQVKRAAGRTRFRSGARIYQKRRRYRPANAALRNGRTGHIYPQPGHCPAESSYRHRRAFDERRTHAIAGGPQTDGRAERGPTHDLLVYKRNPIFSDKKELSLISLPAAFAARRNGCTNIPGIRSIISEVMSIRV